MKRKRDAHHYDDHLIGEAKKIVTALGRMFAPFCEVVLHDLRRPIASILAIENPFSGRRIGDSATRLGLARITQPDFPGVVQNYPNVTADGRQVKSTSIGIRGRDGRYIASICLNMDTTYFSDLTALFQSFVAVDHQAPSMREQLRTLSLEEIRRVIEEFSTSRSTVPKRLGIDDRRELIALLRERGLLELKNSVSTIASVLGVTRPSVYNYLRAAQNR
jgi:predicted transcriptional regulator YheO